MPEENSEAFESSDGSNESVFFDSIRSYRSFPCVSPFTNREARFLCGLKQERDIERLVATAREMNLARQRANSLGHGINLDPS
jgi:hypothetical protein